LCTNSSNEELNIRLASLTTIGYICDELYPNDIEDPLKNQIILALINNISAAPDALEPTKLAIKALPNAIPYANQNFKNAQERDFIMEKIFLACESADEEVRESALNTL
jgi:importin subunit beta-1